MLAGVGADFDERLKPRHQVVAGAQRAAEAIVVAVGIAARGAVGEFRFLVLGALRRALDGDLDAVEALRQAEGAAERRVDREARQPRLHVRAARIVGADDQDAFADQRGVARDVEPSR